MSLECKECGDTYSGFDFFGLCPRCALAKGLVPEGATCTHSSLEAGTAIKYFGDFQILGELGRGGMGTVYRARQISLDRLVALKMVRTSLSVPEALERFRFEAEAIAKLEHPNIVPLYEIGSYHGNHFFSMRLIDGEDLSVRFRGHEIANLREHSEECASIMTKVASAIHHAHEQGILHRDLKPSNVILDQRGEPFITDFGLAKDLSRSSDISLAGVIIGTPSYLAPEIVSAGSVATRASDIYGLGALFYWLLTGRAPFPLNDEVDCRERILSDVATREPRKPQFLRPGIPGDLETICLKAMAKDPQRRYESACDFADDLNRWIDGKPIRARRTHIIERFCLLCHRSPTATFLASTCVLLAIGLWLSVFSTDRPNQDYASGGELGVKRDQALAHSRWEAGLNALERENSEDALAYFASSFRLDSTNLHGIVLANSILWNLHPVYPETSVDVHEIVREGGMARDGSWFAILSGIREDARVVVYDSTTGKLLFSWPGQFVNELVGSPNSQYLALRKTLPGRVEIEIIEVATGVQLGRTLSYSYHSSEKPAVGIRWSPGSRFLLSVADQEIHIWDFANEYLHQTLNISKRPVLGIDIQFDDQILAVCEGEEGSSQGLRRTTIWSLETASLLDQSNPKISGLRQPYFVPGRKLLLGPGGGGGSGTRIWRTNGNRLDVERVITEDWLVPQAKELSFRSDGGEFVVAYRDSLVTWDLEGRERSTPILPSFSYATPRLKWIGQTEWVAVSHLEDSRFRLLNLFGGIEPKPLLSGLVLTEIGDMIAADGSNLLTFPRDDEAIVWNASGLGNGRELLGGIPSDLQVISSTDGVDLYGIRSDGELVWLDSNSISAVSGGAGRGRMLVDSISQCDEGIVIHGLSSEVQLWTRVDGRDTIMSRLQFSGQVRDVRFSGDANRYGILFEDGRLALIDVSSHSILARTKLPVARRTTISLDESGRNILLNSGEEGLASVWQVSESGMLRKVCEVPASYNAEGFPKPVRGRRSWRAFLTSDGETLVTRPSGDVVVITDVPSNKVMLRVQSEQNYFEGVIIEGLEERLITLDQSSGLRLFELSSGREVPSESFNRFLTAPPVFALVDESELRMAVLDREGVVRVWDMANEGLLWESFLIADASNAYFSDSGEYLAVENMTSIVVVQAATGVVRLEPVAFDRYNDKAWFSDGTRSFVVKKEHGRNESRGWDLDTGQPIETDGLFEAYQFENRKGVTSGYGGGRAGDRGSKDFSYSGLSNGQFVILDEFGMAPILGPISLPTRARNLAMSRERGTAAICLERSKMDVYRELRGSTPDKKEVFVSSLVKSARVAARSNEVFCAMDFGGFEAYNLETNQLVKEIAKNSGGNDLFDVSSDGDVVIHQGPGMRRISLLREDNGWDSRTVLAHPGFVSSITIDPNDLFAVTSGQDLSIRVWDLESLESLGEAMLQSEPTKKVRFSTNGEMIVSICENGVCQAWAVPAGEAVSPLIKVGDQVVDAWFCMGDRALLTIDKAGSVRLWDLASGDPMTVTLKHNGAVSHAVFASDSDSILTFTETGEVLKWYVNPLISDAPPEWYSSFLEAVAGKRVDSNNKLREVGIRRRTQTLNSLRSATEPSPYASILQRYFGLDMP